MSEAKFTDDNSLVEDLNELKFSRTQSYFDKSLTIRCIIALFFAATLFFFLHYREVYVETLELGTNAKKYVVSQVDFDFPDEEATVILRQEAAFEIGAIYRLNEQQIKERVTDFQKYITQQPEGKQRWAELNKKSGFEDVALALSILTDGLYDSRFTDSRTVQRIGGLKADDLPLPAKDFFVFSPSSDLPEQELRLSSNYWKLFEKRFFIDRGVPGSIVYFIFDYFENKGWKVGEDQALVYSLRKLTQRAIPQKTTHVRAGETVIDQGEKVGIRHVTMMQAMKEKLRVNRNLHNVQTILGTSFLVLIFLFMGAFYLYRSHYEILQSNRKLALLVAILILSIFLAKAIELLLLRSSNNLFALVRFPLFVPIAAILLTNLLNARIAAMGTIFLSLVFVIALAVATVPFLAINLLASVIAILTGQKIRRRKEVFSICAKAWLAAFCVILAFDLYQNALLQVAFFIDVVSSLIFMMVTAIIVVGLLPIFETFFRIMTDITLMEFMDPSNELLRRLTIEAPGTYQHSMVVGNLAESAATSIGANGLFCRVATQYHDVGKLANPQYFTENQLGAMDMHQLLTPQESTQVIMAHVSEGVALARKVGLPEQFIDVIKEHHGTTLVYYFYHKQIELTGGDKSEVDEKEFRYSGPKPRTKESTVIMIADTLEAASRSLDSFTEETVTELVDTLIAQKMEDGQFDDSMLTFEELGIVKNVLIKTLLAASHPRIKYPAHSPGEEG
ncbi:MAG: hypothetical protein S4CHLAM45_05120 [Chlamydiales bacterium]|nr:hypothetical protein [Chlamydiales bacterium]MCH9619947.1 hypothetical protein [Chlamydiales bacterium]MCH9622626.1 hypothetical protein [Chlamydiales bacterium]